MENNKLIERLSRNYSEEEIDDFLKGLNSDDIIDLQIELLGGI